MAYGLHTEVNHRLDLVNQCIKVAKKQIPGSMLGVGFVIYFLIRIWIRIEEDGPVSLFAFCCYLFLLGRFLKILDWHTLWVERRILQALAMAAESEFNSSDSAAPERA